MEIQVNGSFISRVSSLMMGILWDNEDRYTTIDVKKLIFLSYEEIDNKK
jgi:hypothetical protein